jgi:hypothetical protein
MARNSSPSCKPSSVVIALYCFLTNVLCCKPTSYGASTEFWVEPNRGHESKGIIQQSGDTWTQAVRVAQYDTGGYDLRQYLHYPVWRDAAITTTENPDNHRVQARSLHVTITGDEDERIFRSSCKRPADVLFLTPITDSSSMLAESNIIVASVQLDPGQAGNWGSPLTGYGVAFVLH